MPSAFLRSTVARTATLVSLTAAATCLGWLSQRTLPTDSQTKSPAYFESARTDNSPSSFFSADDPVAYAQRAGMDQLIATTRDGLNEKSVRAFHSLLHEMPLADFPRALAHLRARRESELAHLVAGAWAERDLPGAWAWLLQQPHHDFEEAMLDTWLHQAPDSFFAWFAEHAAQLPASHASSLLGYVTRLTATLDPERGLPLITQIAPSSRPLFYRAWARADPPSAARRAQEEPDATLRHQALENVYLQWMMQHRDPAAMAAAAALPDEADRLHAQIQVGLGLLFQGYRPAADFLAALPSTPEVGDAQREAIRDWCRQDGPAATTWIFEQTDPDLARALFPTLVRFADRPKLTQAILALPTERRTDALRLAQSHGLLAAPRPPAPTR